MTYYLVPVLREKVQRARTLALESLASGLMTTRGVSPLVEPRLRFRDKLLGIIVDEFGTRAKGGGHPNYVDVLAIIGNRLRLTMTRVRNSTHKGSR